MLLELNKIADESARRLELDVVEMNSAVNRLLVAASRQTANRPLTQPQTVELKKVAEDVIFGIFPLAELRSCTLSLVINQPQSFMGYQPAVMEAVLTIVENAIKRGPEGNVISISCGPDCTFSIDDVGSGATVDGSPVESEETLDGKAPAFWTDLDLSVVKAAVDLHNGSIELARNRFGGTHCVLRFDSVSSGDFGIG